MNNIVKKMILTAAVAAAAVFANYLSTMMHEGWVNDDAIYKRLRYRSLQQYLFVL